MVAERVPCQVAHEAMVLMEIVARVGEHEVGVDAGFSASKVSLTSAAS